MMLRTSEQFINLYKLQLDYQNKLKDALQSIFSFLLYSNPRGNVGLYKIQSLLQLFLWGSLEECAEEMSSFLYSLEPLYVSVFLD